MFTIDSQSTKPDVLSHLGSVSKITGDLVIELSDLPRFLETKPAFHIFKFQLQNYPRPIKWTSQDISVMEFLLDCEADILTSAASLTLPDINRELVKFKEKLGMVRGKPKGDIETTIQNLDSWVEKIENTKHALIQLKQQNQLISTSETQEQKQSTEETKKNIIEVIREFISSHKTAQVLTSAAAISSFFVLAIVLFPTKVFTLEVRPLTFEDSVTMEIPLDTYTKTQVSLEATGSLRPTGNSDGTNRPSGRAFLVNNSNEEVQLTSGNFKLVNFDTGAKYIHVKDATQSDNFVIPANNAKVGDRLEITIVAEQDNQDYNLTDNVKLEITNLIDQRACGNCFAVTSSFIKPSESKGQKVITTADQALLRNNLNSQIAEKRINEIKNLSSSKILTNPNWFKNLATDYQFSNEIGAQSDEFSLKERTSMDLYSLPQQYITEEIKKTNNEATNITDIVVVSSDENVSNILEKPVGEQKLNIKFFYTYTKQMTLDKNIIAKTLSQQQFEDARSDIKKKYPTVRDIQQRDMGLSIPGIPARVDVKVNE